MKSNWSLKLAILAALSSGSAMAGEVVFDGTLPGTTAGALVADAGTYSINQDRGYVNGSNLFHSLLRFNIDAGETAVFHSTDEIRNILARVTGNVPTNIDGTLTASNPNITSFWLINPAGIMIGEDAVLDIPGAVAIGAADFIQFSNGESWSALNDGFSDASTLSVNPVDFGFLSNSTAGELTIRGQNFASTGADRITDRFGEQRSWLLSGGSGVTIESGTDLLLSEVKVETPKGAGAGGVATGNISIVSDANVTIDRSFIASTSTGDDVVSDGSGSIDIHGSSVTLNQSHILSRTSTNAAAGRIAIVGSEITLNGSTIETSTSGSGDAGSIRVESPTITLNGSTFYSSTTGNGNGGDILVGSGLFGANEPEGSSITLNQTSISSSSSSSSQEFSPAGGQIFLQAFTIALNGGIIESSGSGNGAAGDIFVGSGLSHGSEAQIGSSITLDGTNFQSSATGNSSIGDIVLHAFSISLNGGAIESTNSSFGDGGDILLGSGELDLTPDTQTPLGNFGISMLEELNGSSITLHGTTFRSNATGNPGVYGGVITLNAHRIALNGGNFESNGLGFFGGGGGFFVGALANRDGSSITLNGTTFSSTATGGGSGGQIYLQARNITLNESILDTTVSEFAVGGLIVIDDDGELGTVLADSSLTMIDSRVTTGIVGCVECDEAPFGGVIHLSSGSIRLLNSAVTSEPPDELPVDLSILLGDIFIVTHPSGELRLEGSHILSRAGNANGGNIFIGGQHRLFVDPPMLDRAGGQITLVNSTIEASAGADGRGGDITIFAGQTILQGSGILARAEDGDGGRIEIGLVPGEVFLQDSASLVSADSGSGIDGEITINSPDVDWNAALQPQDVDVSTPTALGSNACSAANTQSRSTFVRTGRGGVADRPDGYLTSISAEATEAAQRDGVSVAISAADCL
jgi:filamentous hemagglutinin family protein